MTDRHSAYIVVLDHDIRSDDAAESILVALSMLKGVQSVEPLVADPIGQLAYSRVIHDLRGRLLKVLDDAERWTP